MACTATLGLVHCKGTMIDEKTVVSWSVSGLPPTYTERRWRADVPAALKSDLVAQVQKVHFFDLPADLGANNPSGGDMGSYSITVTIGARTHTVHYSDSSVTQEMANLRKWLSDHLASTATTE